MCVCVWLQLHPFPFSFSFHIKVWSWRRKLARLGIGLAWSWFSPVCWHAQRPSCSCFDLYHITTEIAFAFVSNYCEGEAMISALPSPSSTSAAMQTMLTTPPTHQSASSWAIFGQAVNLVPDRIELPKFSCSLLFFIPRPQPTWEDGLKVKVKEVCT